MLRSVTAIVLPGVAPFELGVVCEVFGIDRRDTGGPSFDFTVCAVEPDLVPTKLGLGIMVERGLDDELKGSAYAVIDGVDGRTHHVRLSDLEATGDGAPGAIVELRRFEDARGQPRVALAVRSDLDLDARLFPHLTDQSLLQGLAVLDLASGQGPPPGPLGVLVQQQNRVVLDDDARYARMHPATLAFADISRRTNQ